MGIQTIQRRLIKKTEEVVEKELLIQEKEKLYLELKHILARQPGPEVAEQLQVYKKTLQEKTKQLKGMASELNMYESQTSDFKFEIERLSKELQEAKKKYYLQKKKEQTPNSAPVARVEQSLRGWWVQFETAQHEQNYACNGCRQRTDRRWVVVT